VGGRLFEVLTRRPRQRVRERGRGSRVGLVITWKDLWCHLIGDFGVIRQGLMNDVGGS